MQRVVIFCFLILAVFCSSVWSDKITLKSGKVYEGEIISETDNKIIIDFRGIEITIPKSKIAKIDKPIPTSIPLPHKEIQPKRLQKTKYDFRKTKWGTSIESVKQIENDKSVKELPEGLSYDARIANLDCIFFYKFINDKLYASAYAVVEEHSNKNDYISDYDKLRSYLTKKYDPPINEDIIWKNDLYKDDPQYWGLAISRGDLIYFSKWETTTTNIILFLSGDNHKIILMIEYLSKEFKHLKKDAVEKETLEIL